MIEVLLGFVVLTQCRRRDCQRAVGGGFFVAIAQLEAEFECGFGFVVRLRRAGEQEEALGAATSQFGDDITSGDERECMWKDFVIALERRLGVPLLELDVAEVLEPEELGAGFGGGTQRPFNCKYGPRSGAFPRVQMEERFEQADIPKMVLVLPSPEHGNCLFDEITGCGELALLPERHGKRATNKGGLESGAYLLEADDSLLTCFDSIVPTTEPLLSNA